MPRQRAQAGGPRGDPRFRAQVRRGHERGGAAHRRVSDVHGVLHPAPQAGRARHRSRGALAREPGGRNDRRAGRHRRVAPVPGEGKALHAGRADRGTTRGRRCAAVCRRRVLHHLSRAVQLPPDSRAPGWRDLRIRQHAGTALAGESGRRPQRGEALLRQRAPDHFPEDAPRRVRCGGDRRYQRRADPRRIRRWRHQCAAHPPAGTQDVRAPAAHGEGRRAGGVRDGLDRRRALRAGSEARAAPAARAADQARRSAGIAMSQKIRGVKGTRDVLPIDTYVKDDDPWVRVGHYQLIEQTARELFPLYGYREARTPILERTELFVRGIGEVTDIVGKEMYTSDDRGESVTLRPENTASLVRAYVEHNVNQQEPETKWWYLGPMFRRERQQRGRYRQFTQIGIEAFGSPGPRIDAEQIELLDRWLRRLGIPFEMHLNTLGDGACRPKYREALQAYLRSRAADLCEDCRKRIETNPIRVLDCKNPKCQEVAGGAPKMAEFLCDACRAHFDGLQNALKALGVSFVIDAKLVRGLDYYTRTTYEAIATSGLGAQRTVAGGGRYDGLVKELGGPDVPGIGFAAGVERLALLVAQQDKESATRPLVFIAPLGDAEAARADELAQQLRAAGLPAEVSFRKANPGNQLKRADALGARYALVLGDAELKAGRARLKELKTGAQHEVSLDGFAEEVKKLAGR